MVMIANRQFAVRRFMIRYKLNGPRRVVFIPNIWRRNGVLTVDGYDPFAVLSVSHLKGK